MSRTLPTARPSETDPKRCETCGQKIYPTQTAQGTRYAHKDSKMLFCTNGVTVSNPRSVVCPACNAPVGQSCNAPTEFGRRDVNWHHSSRVDLAEKEESGDG